MVAGRALEWLVQECDLSNWNVSQVRKGGLPPACLAMGVSGGNTTLPNLRV